MLGQQQMEEQGDQRLNFHGADFYNMMNFFFFLLCMNNVLVHSRLVTIFKLEKMQLNSEEGR